MVCWMEYSLRVQFSHHKLLMNWRMCEQGKVNIQFEIHCQGFSRVCQRESMKARALWQFAESAWAQNERAKKEFKLQMQLVWVKWAMCSFSWKSWNSIRIWVWRYLFVFCGTMCIQLKQCVCCGGAQKWPDKDSEFYTHNARLFYSTQCNAMQNGSL